MSAHREWSAGRLGLGASLTALAALLVAALSALLAPAAASAAFPVLEVVVPQTDTPPVRFTTESGTVDAYMAGFGTLVQCAASSGEGEITGPRLAVALFHFTGCDTQEGVDGGQECKSEHGSAQEIQTPLIDAELVWVNQSKREVAILLNPHGGEYMSFQCGGEAVEASGSFLASLGPLDEQTTSFTATLSQHEGTQTPDAYEDEAGEQLPAVPMATRGTEQPAETGVEATMTVQTSAPIEVDALSAAEVEAAQRKEEEALVREYEALDAEWLTQYGSGEPGGLTAGDHALSGEHALATLKIVSAKVVGEKLMLTVRTSAGGVITVSGAGVRRFTRMLERAGLHRFEVQLPASSRSAARRRRARLTVRLRDASGAVLERMLTLNL